MTIKKINNIKSNKNLKNLPEIVNLDKVFNNQDYILYQQKEYSSEFNSYIDGSIVEINNRLEIENNYVYTNLNEFVVFFDEVNKMNSFEKDNEYSYDVLKSISNIKNGKLYINGKIVTNEINQLILENVDKNNYIKNEIAGKVLYLSRLNDIHDLKVAFFKNIFELKRHKGKLEYIVYIVDVFARMRYWNNLYENYKLEDNKKTSGLLTIGNRYRLIDGKYKHYVSGNIFTADNQDLIENFSVIEEFTINMFVLNKKIYQLVSVISESEWENIIKPIVHPVSWYSFYFSLLLKKDNEINQQKVININSKDKYLKFTYEPNKIFNLGGFNISELLYNGVNNTSQICVVNFSKSLNDFVDENGDNFVDENGSIYLI